MTKTILGIHGGFTINQHDPAAALIRGGRLVACVEEERLVRVKAPRGLLPLQAIRACLKEAGLTMQDVDLVVHPGETYEDVPPRIQSYFKHYFGYCPPVRMINHQMAHLASAFFHSGYEEAMCLSYDAYGDRLSAALAKGGPDGITILETRDAGNSLGTFYATVTSFLGFFPAEDEYKVMGLAAMGHPGYDLSVFARPVADGYSIDNSFVRTEPSIKTILEPFYSDRLVGLCGEPRRMGEPITQRHADIAYAAQKSLEVCAMSLVTHLHKLTGSRNLCLAGGVGLNCSANLFIGQLPFVDRMFVQPAASDRGMALGCALQAAFEEGEKVEPLTHVYYGPSYSNDDLLAALTLVGADFAEVSDPAEAAAELLAQECIVGWYQGRSEFGPRALGHRSILADPRPAYMKDEINARVKYREEFRPFAPAVEASAASTYFDMDEPSPYMTRAFNVRERYKAILGATTHVNGTARVQTVAADSAAHFHAVISEFGKKTGTPVVLNTSFNIKGQPIVETPLDALSTFMGTGMDALVLGPYVVRKPCKPRGKPIPKIKLG